MKESNFDGVSAMIAANPLVVLMLGEDGQPTLLSRLTPEQTDDFVAEVLVQLRDSRAERQKTYDELVARRAAAAKPFAVIREPSGND